MKLLIAGGGTGGHVSPGLAVAKAWEKSHGAGTASWAGRPGGIEERMAKAEGLRFLAVEARPLRRSLDPQNLVLPLILAKGLRQAWAILAKEKPPVLLVTGGYVSVPMAMSAVLRGVPLVLLEPNAVLGIANRVFSGAAEAICLAYPMKHAPRHAVLTGNPVRFAPKLPSKAAALMRFGLEAGIPTVLVLPGSGAAHSINVAVTEMLKKARGMQLLWMTGAADHAEAAAAAKACKIRASVHEFIQDVPSAYAVADLVLARCGASMLAEIAIAGKPSLLVPYPHATGDHQRLNALGFAEAGAGRMILDRDLSGDALLGELSGLLADAGRLKRMAGAARKLGKADAAENVAGLLHRVAKGFKYV